MYESKVAFNTHPAALSSVGPASPNIISGKGPQTDEGSANVQHAAHDQPQIKGARFQNQEALNNTFNQISQSIGKVSRAMDEIEARVDKISDKLTGFRKIFPPYPPGSEERVKLYKSFSALRKQIQQLTYPPEDEGARAIMAPGDSGNRSGEGITVQGPDLEIGVRPQNLQFSPQGINIPQMSPEPKDEEIDHILGQLENTRQSLQDKRMGLQKDVEHLFLAKEDLTVHGTDFAAVKDSILPQSITEPEAEEISHRIHDILAGQKEGIAENQTVMKPFLE
jgi:hypothetical protein